MSRGTGCARWRSFLATVTFCCLNGAAAFGHASRYLIVAAPSTSRISYMKLPESGAPALDAGQMEPLISTGLTFPQGLAVDEYRNMLYVADPALGRLVGYRLERSRSGALSVGAQQTIASGCEVRAVTVDGVGNVFMTDEPTQRLLKVTAEMVQRGQTTPIVVYEGASQPALRAPGGITTDNYFVYWLNKAQGTDVGTLVRAPQSSPRLAGQNSSAGLAMTLASNTPKAYGLCLALGNIFYTDEYNLYGVPRAAIARDEYVTVSSTLQEPRGCAYDGDGTVYVADKSANAIYRFASNRLQAGVSLSRAAEMEGAYGVAIYSAITS